MAGTPVRTACQALGNVVTNFERDIQLKQGWIDDLRERLEKLQSKPDPDPDQIEQIKGDIQKLEEQLASDRPQLQAAIDDYEYHCGSWPPAG